MAVEFRRKRGHRNRCLCTGRAFRNADRIAHGKLAVGQGGRCKPRRLFEERVNVTAQRSTYSLFSTSAGLLLAAFSVCDPIIMNAISNTVSNPANSSVICTGS